MIAIMSLGALGAWVAMGPGMVFEPFAKFVERRGSFTVFGRTFPPWIPAKLRHPLATCARCMVSIWGSIAVVILGVVPEGLTVVELVVCWPVYLLCAVGLQELLSR